MDIKQRLDNDDHYDGDNTKEYIVIHGTGNQNDTAEGNANYFCTGKRSASAHYFTDNDSIIQVVKDDDCAWHVGDGKGKYGITNKNSIGIEMCVTNGVYAPATIQNTLDLVKMLMQKYNVPYGRVVRHYDASRKNCPSQFNLDGKWGGWSDFQSKLREPQTYTVKVTADFLNIRKGAGTGFAITGQIKKNEVYTIVEEFNGWGKLKSGAGWVSLKFCQKV